MEAIVFLCVARPPPVPVMLEAYAKLPVVKTLFAALHGLAVPLKAAGTLAEFRENCTQTGDGGQPSGRTAAVRDAIKQYKATWQPGQPPLGILPEGTTTNGRVLVKFFTGAFDGGGAIQPILVQFPFRRRNAAAWLRGGLGDYILSILLNPWQRVVITFLPATQPQTLEEEADPAAFAERVRFDMASACSLPLSDYTAKMLRDEDRMIQPNTRIG
eukprot:CAMPEP_0115853354 /NCGR_PEP_ID=MMETSP0287-20121206/13461_1 /TAXON_ID=412157 /ORGANISM="Chrysochromulina rotalis, Strain UIO044" /LENGTH=214 /DNA_ID=CAMNT_0003307429 /DNA_START=367 /DNA_END=1011 /DNA_ORIENTATION=+